MEDKIGRITSGSNSGKRLGLLILCLLLQLSTTQVYAQWEKAPGPFIKLPLAFLSCTAKGDTVFAGTYREGGVFRSTDGGQNWVDVFQHAYVYSIAIIGKRVFLGTDDGVFESTDFGNSWEADTNGISPDMFVFSITGSGQFLVAGTGDGVYISRDGGERWEESPSAIINHGLGIHSVYTDDSVVFAGTTAGVFRSEDYGITWDSASTGLPGAPGSVYALTSEGSFLFAGTGNGVYRSSDEGRSWVAADSGLPGNYGYAGYQGVFSVAANDGVIYAGPEGTGWPYESTDSGRTWIPLFPNITSAYVFDFCFVKSTVFAATLDGLYRGSSEPNTWQPSLTEFKWGPSLTSVFNYGGELLASGQTIYYNGDINSTFYSSDSGKTWGEFYLPNTFPPFNSFLSYGSAIYGVTAEGVEVTTSGGAIWNAFNYGLPQYSVNALFDYDGEIFAGIGTKYGPIRSESSAPVGGIYTFGNGKASWTFTGLADTAVYSFTSIGTELLAGTSDGVFLSTDGGISWHSRSSGLPNDSRIYSMCQAGGKVYAATYDNVYVSDYFLLNWRKSNTAPLQESSGYNPVTLFPYRDNVLATTDEGVYELDPTGNWESRDSGLAGTELSVHYLTTLGNYIYAATDGGLMRRAVPDLLKPAANSSLPSHYYLYQNYPNPFNPSTTISFFLPNRGHVTLSVYDVLGRLVATLVDGEVSAGYHEAIFDGSRYSSGAYFYRLTTPTYSKVMKMMMIR